MKKLVFLLAVVFLSSVAFAQKISKGQVPPAVMQMMYTKTFDTVSPTWELAGDIYKASFSKGELFANVVIKQSGEWVKTAWTMPYKYVPQGIKDNVTANYKGYKVSSSAAEYRTDGDYYVISVKKAKDIKSLLYSLKGEFVKVESDLITPMAVPKP